MAPRTGGSAGGAAAALRRLLPCTALLCACAGALPRGLGDDDLGDGHCLLQIAAARAPRAALGHGEAEASGGAGATESPPWDDALRRGDGPSVSAGSANATAAVVPLAGTPEVLLSELPDTVTIGSRARFIDSNISPEATAVLHAPQPWKLNMACCLIILGVVLATAAGCILGQQRWMLYMAVASYVTLIPGLFSKDFSLNIAVVISDIPLVPDVRLQITSPMQVPGPIRESTRSVLPLLWQTHSHSGAVLIAVFAFVVPVVKIAVLLLAEHLRDSEEVSKVKLARRCIIFVQIVSKWASPDMFAFALLYSLLRSLHRPPFLESLQVLEVGFSCYSVFCVSSVISTMALSTPRHPDEPPQGRGRLVRLVERIGTARVRGVTWLLMLAWLALFVRGVGYDGLTMRLDSSVLMEALDLPTSLEPVFRSLGLADLVHTRVSLWSASSDLWVWFWDSGEINLLLAATMLGGFGITLTVLDMAVLAVIASGEDVLRRVLGDEALATRQGLLSLTHVLRHIAMLDVFATGVIVVSYAASIYKEQGLVIELASGILYALASEVVHYLTYYLVLAMEEASGVSQEH